MKYKTLIILGLALLALALVLAACGSNAPAEPTKPAPVAENLPAQAAACPTAPACPAPVTNTAEQVVKDVPNQDAWASSAHADKKAMAFNDWNQDNPPEIPATCAKCHSTPGFQDFLGADGSAAGKVDKAAPIGTTIECVACHNSATAKLTSVTFPSGLTVDNLGPEARCMTCHQGRESKKSVDDRITKAGITDADTVIPKQGFVNIHYLAAGATQYGTQAQGGYEYDGKTYARKFDHVENVNTCASCHDSHTLEVKVDTCKTCHKNVGTVENLKDIRMPGSTQDYNGNGNVQEGISKEIEGLQVLLMQDIQAYATEVMTASIAYKGDAYPYFFVDANKNGKVDDDEKTKYPVWTPRLLKAAYNYQFSVKDPGAYAHNAKYVIELLHDSIEDLNAKVSKPIDLSKASRDDSGHFNGTGEQFRHWDKEGAVPAGCSKCHSATGLPQFLGEAAASSDKVTGSNVSNPVSNGLACSTCHTDLTTFARRQVDKVKFPSGAVLSFGDANDSNLCISCHQARESTVSVDGAIKKAGAATDDTVSDKLSFRNPHYFGAGATLFGTDAKGAYEFAGQTYNGQNLHTNGFNTCTACHDTHASEVKVQACSGCHQGVKTVDDLKTIRMTDAQADYDGNGKAEGLGLEVDGMAAQLYAAIQKYATDKAKVAIVYDAGRYPYFFADTNGNGKVDADEKAYAAWTPNLLRAAYNLQWVNKDPGAFAHNGHYMIQVLYDSIKAVGGDVSKMTRPAVSEPTK